MDYTQDILTRLQNGESIEDIAASLTKSINDAQVQHQEAQAKAEAEAKKKAAEEAVFQKKVALVTNMITDFTELFSYYDVDEEILEAVREADPVEVAKEMDLLIPMFSKYYDFMEMLQKEVHQAPAAGPTGVCQKVPVHKVSPNVDPIEAFLNQYVRL